MNRRLLVHKDVSTKSHEKLLWSFRPWSVEIYVVLVYTHLGDNRKSLVIDFVAALGESCTPNWPYWTPNYYRGLLISSSHVPECSFHSRYKCCGKCEYDSWQIWRKNQSIYVWIGSPLQYNKTHHLQNKWVILCEFLENYLKLLESYMSTLQSHLLSFKTKHEKWMNRVEASETNRSKDYLPIVFRVGR